VLYICLEGAYQGVIDSHFSDSLFTCFHPMGTTMLPKSISSSAQYVILHIEIWIKKSQNMHVWIKKVVLALQNCSLQGWLVKGATMLHTSRKKSVINMT
jgi:hypothetical protein